MTRFDRETRREEQFVDQVRTLLRTRFRMTDDQAFEAIGTHGRSVMDVYRRGFGPLHAALDVHDAIERERTTKHSRTR